MVKPLGPVVLDACVLYPTVMRRILLGLAETGLFQPIWSSRILDEWARAAVRNHPDQGDIVAGEIAVCAGLWPESNVEPVPAVIDRLTLPDPDDTHVLATAVAAGSPLIVTLNLKDFPRRTLAPEGVEAQHPDQFARDLMDENEDALRITVEAVRVEAERLSGQNRPVRKLLKKARMPRLGKALA